ncbi:MAG: PKD domain-containing protein, partial [Bacteroidia bacterium]|nr:PKD domain-containing protein [Bacteroidia bacterium]
RTVVVTLVGPGSCRSEKQGIAIVPGICPELGKPTPRIVGQSLQTHTVEVVIPTEKATPDLYLWNWGDGSTEEESTTNVLRHIYTRKAGDEQSFTLTVTSKGPGSSDQCDKTVTTKVEVPGYCPAIMSLKLSSVAGADEKTEIVTAKATVTQGSPDRYIWVWGPDIANTETTVPEASYEYPRLPGAPRQVTVAVKLEGPDHCYSYKSAETEIPGLCPQLLNWRAERLTQDEESVTWKVSLEVEDADLIPEDLFTYTWNWGDGSALQETNVPTATHQFVRPSEDQVFTIYFDLMGPGGCSRTGCTKVKVEGTCPVITGIDHDFCRMEADFAELKFEVEFRQKPKPEGLPDSYVWQWGDGSLATVTDQPFARHRFKRKENLASYPVTVIASGGGCACETSFTTTVELPGSCPIVTDIRSTYGKAEAATQEVTLTAILRGGKPRVFEWNFGDGSPVLQSPSGSVRHVFKRTQERYRVKVTIIGSADAYGGKNCRHSLEADIEIDLPVLVG